MRKNQIRPNLYILHLDSPAVQGILNFVLSSLPINKITQVALVSSRRVQSVIGRFPTKQKSHIR